jgi:sulfonate transport system substrate-binding protein
MTTLRIAGVPEPYNLPWHLAMEKGHFAKAGVDLHWHTVPEGTGRMCQMLRDDELDMAVLVTEGAVRDILNGGPHRIVSTFVESPLPWGVHVPAHSSLHAPADLKGIPFAISRKGSGSHLMAMLYAQQLGWRPKDEDLIVVNNMEGAAERMKSGQPLVFLWETYVTSRYVDAGVMRRVDEVRGDWPGFVIVAREEFIASHRKLIEKGLAALRAEVQELKNDPRSVELVVKNAGFKKELAQEWLKHVRWQVSTPDRASLQHLIVMLRELDLVDASSKLDPVR